MPRKAGGIVSWIVVTEVVEEEKGVEVLGLAKAERPLELDSSAFHDCFCLDDLPNWAERHLRLLQRICRLNDYFLLMARRMLWIQVEVEDAAGWTFPLRPSSKALIMGPSFMYSK
jgi:hypothetical protein